jgi:hypothetical protein
MKAISVTIVGTIASHLRSETPAIQASAIQTPAIQTSAVQTPAV